jgi:hypothetical protein
LERSETSKRTTRRIGYGVAVAVNGAMLAVVNNLLAWDWLPWLTDDFERVLIIINVSLVASMIANVLYIADDRPGFKGPMEFGLLIISLIATVRLLQVFPFDFSPYDVAWDTLARWGLAAVIAAISIAMIVQLVQLARIATDLEARASASRPPADSDTHRPG